MSRTDEIARFFTACMEDPARPTHCARVLCACLHALDGRRDYELFALDLPFFPPQFEGYESLRKTHHAYLTACVTFLSTLRSKEELEELAASISVCACPAPSAKGAARTLVARLHRFKPARQFTFRDFVEALVRHLGGILNHAVETKTISGAAASGGLKRNAKKHAECRLWPVGASQLVPSGLEQSMQGYVASFRLCRDSRFQDTLLVVMEFLSLFGGPVLRHILQFEPDWALRISALVCYVLKERNETLGRPVRMDMETGWLHTITLILMFCSKINEEGERNPRDVAHFVTWNMSGEKNGSTILVNCGLLLVCTVIRQEIQSFRNGTILFTNEIIERFSIQSACFAARLYCYRPQDDGLEYHPDILRMRAKTDAFLADPLRTAFEGFCWAARLRHCCAPECNETFATAGRPFSRCAGCGVLRYCSRECQKSAWRNTRTPHKDVCPKLRVVRERTKLPREPRVPDHFRDLPPFIDACNADEGLRVLANDCGIHMYYLMTVRQDFGVDHVPEAFRALFAATPDVDGE
ncbi:uncharacterized protein C8Q71DRAFT_89855 [Rhodofomes roseus]|uniref:MYND-type domain-containing protein n=1 Tax=Rhodofomes roseus TaxID=34475 RepID=A0ABQ8KDG0_9APHY|nr:uncharacterized protein C8Q71DRAFT_89855 [Rhodofomes roseus]KAH9835657.1 hypothetical protein C8Q71DRAFT_89855 [Rhodofomes roseus]